MFLLTLCFLGLLLTPPSGKRRGEPEGAHDAQLLVGGGIVPGGVSLRIPLQTGSQDTRILCQSTCMALLVD
jgi:hypothetical protein